MNKYCKFKLFKNIISYIVITILVIFIAMSFLNVSVISRYKFYDVLTGSMDPTIKIGSLIIVKQIDDKEVKKGDIITFKSNSTSNLTTHRVMEVINDKQNIQFQTKGDANDVMDPMLIDGDLLVGKVIFNVPNIGVVMRTIGRYRGIIIILIIVYLFFNKFL